MVYYANKYVVQATFNNYHTYSPKTASDNNHLLYINHTYTHDILKTY